MIKNFYGLSLITSILLSDPIDFYWQQKVDYDMDITLHDSIRQIAGTTVIKYTNNSPDSLNKLYLHLYPNAFQTGSVKSREYISFSGRTSRAKYFKNKLDGFTSKIEIHDFDVALPEKGASWIHKIPILKSFNIDDTILEAVLQKKIGPGDVVRIDLNWTHHVGEMVERAGYYKGQYNMAQWYPKMAVYDENGWHADVFHAEGEFYGEFGDFNVKFDIPSSFIIGASGIVIDGDPGWNSVTVDTSIDFNKWVENFDSTYVVPDPSSRRNITFLAENVHDFAWVASKDFLYEKGKHNEIDVHVLYDKGRGEDWTKVVLDRSIRAIAWLEDKFGKYPYPQITTTDRVKNGGMEYPMLVMNGRASEGLIVHEYGHVYFYGILANNELDDSWLDEGFTTTQTSHYLMTRYGDHGFDKSENDYYQKFPSKNFPLESDLHQDQWSAIRFMRSGHDENISRPSYLFSNGTAYSRNAYTKPSLMLTELRYLFDSDSLYYAAMKYYYQKWKLKHVNEERFIDAMEEFTQQDLNWFFDSWLHTTNHLDYGISSFKKIKNNNNKWSVDLGIKNYGSRFMPLKIETKLADGSIDVRWWENHKWRFSDTFSYELDSKPLSVAIDPDVQTVDLDYRNNTTKMRNTIIFDWPGLYYNPRDQYVYRWSPQFYYNESKSDFSPGIKLKRNYGPYELSVGSVNYALESNKLFWYISGWREHVHIMPRTRLYYWAFNKPGVKEYGLKIRKEWNRIYGRTPTHAFSLGFYAQPEYDIEIIKHLGYDDGKVAVGYVDWSSKVSFINLNVNASTTLGSFSDWNFTKITSTWKFSKTKSIFTFNQKGVLGKIWTDDKVLPSQEAFNIEGNVSNDLLRKNYLVDQFYGIEDLFMHYHMPGDGNIRGLVNGNKEGAEALVAASNELVLSENFYEISTELALFTDFGAFFRRKIDQFGLDKEYSDIQRVNIFADVGLGLRFNTSVFEKDLYVRFDLPFLIYDGSDGSDWSLNSKNWVFSFQRSL
ncbi:MAG: M1 family aminopeptidase [Candidatus Neomarinimicrobiota bacterium]